ncbi:GIY-YIG nuclease family protein [Paracoccus sp. PARArs4]|uniref:GIY-YIG nuclease family protein n=1 Tax=Paracoccus sp. PARArs4 TaxID=2853442 RepID=UPI0024A6AB15|nr:GIY-YIG nuclease family protein [Paracoccus sp. PARArs4]
MSNGLPDGKRIRSRSFYGFSPEEDGYVGWSNATDRDAYLRKLNDGDLIMIYGVSTSETKKAERSYVLGSLEIEARAILDEDKASDVGMARKRDRGWLGRWSHAIPVRRAWRTEEKLLISQIAYRSYRAEAGRALAVHGAELDEDEIEQAMKIRVRAVNVFGEPPVEIQQAEAVPFGNVFKPSRAFPGSHGERTAIYEDGNTYVYLAVFDGYGHAPLDRRREFGDKSVAMKIGVSNDVKRRLSELNDGIPPAARGKSTISMISQAFSTN